MTNKNPSLKISFNAPAVLGFTAICLIAQVLNVITAGGANRAIFSVYRSSLLNPLTYLRLIGHVFGHSGWNHLINNMMYILILGPMLEEKYGSKNMILVMLITALSTGIINMIFFPRIHLLGASGIVFAMILLASITSTDEQAIPVSFILVAVLYIGQQIVQGLFSADHISQLSHIIGGIVGSIMGFLLNQKQPSYY